MNSLLRLYAEHAERVFRQRFRPDCCLNVTRIGLECLRELGLGAEPLSVRCMAMNRQYRQTVQRLGRPPSSFDEAETGAWCVALEPDRDNLQWGPAVLQGQPTGWAGHLVVIAQKRWLVDCSAGQMSRPERDIHVPQIVVTEVSDKFTRKGRQHFLSLRNGGVLIYQKKEDESYAAMPGFQQSTHNIEAAREILRRVRGTAPEIDS
jgi:hypothetical protein